MIIANDFDMNIRDLDTNNHLYQTLAMCELLHNASLMIDDIEDQSLKRRGKDCAYIKYGLDIAINAGCLLLNLPLTVLLSKINTDAALKQSIAMTALNEITCLHFGQNWDISWHSSNIVPTQDEYFQMTTSKTSVIFRLVATLVCRLNAAKHNLSEEYIGEIEHMTNKLGIAFQIQDDVIALESDAYAETRGIVGEDIHEGKRTLMVIHACNNLPKTDSQRLIEILNMNTEDKATIKEAIDMIKSTDR